MTQAGSRPTESRWLYALAGALMVGGPVWQYLYSNHYPFDRPEAVVLPLAAAALGAAIAMLGTLIGGMAETVAFILLAVVFVDLQFDLQSWLLFLLAATAAVALSLILRSKRALLACLMLGAFDLSSLPRAPEAQAGQRTATVVARRDPPLLVHIVLDEQWGIGGIRAAGDSATANFLTAFYRDRDFEVYPAAYSRWHHTRHSIPRMLFLGDTPKLGELEGVRFRMPSNPFFERLDQDGYRIHVFQSSHIDFCGAENITIALCDEIPVVTIANIGYLNGPWETRGLLAGWQLLANTSYLYGLLPSRFDGSVLRRSYIGRGLAQLGRAQELVTNKLGAGDALFIHVLMPHRPLEVDSQCQLYHDLRKRLNYLPRRMAPAAWHEALDAYGAQVRCTHLALASLIRAIDEKVGRDGAVVLIHGDHGSRMSPDNPRATNISSFDAEHMNAEFSTLLAIRRPHVPGAVYDEPVPLQDYFWELVQADFGRTPRHLWEHFLRDQRDNARPSAQPFADTIRVLSPEQMVWAPAPPAAPGRKPEPGKHT